MTLDLSQSSSDGVTILSPTGRIDHATATAFQDALLAAVDTDTPVLIDMSGVEYISSLGLRSFMIAAKQQKAGLACAKMTAPVAEIFKISKFDMVIKCHPSTEAAMNTLKGS